MTNSDGNAAPTPTMLDFYRSYGFAVYAWNRAEQSVRNLLATIAAEDIHAQSNPRAVILTAELGSRGIVQALQSFANATMEAEAQDAVIFLVRYFEIVLSYRNYYVHGVTHITSANPNPKDDKELNENPIGLIRHVSSKGKIIYHEDSIDYFDLERFIQWSNLMVRYSNQLSAHIYWPGERAPLPDKPTLPPQLVKRVQPYRSPRHRRPSSQG